MKIPFAAISEAGVRYTFDDVPVRTKEEDFALRGPVRFSCVLRKKKGTGIFLQGVLQAHLLLCCDRCLATYPYRVHSEMRLIYEVDPQEQLRIKDVDLPADGLNIIELPEPVIDLEEEVRQQLYIALPLQRLCRENCKGLCPGCGSDLNIDPCRCSGKRSESPFAVLSTLKKE